MPGTIPKPSTAASRRFSMDILFVVGALALIIGLLAIIELLDRLDRS